MFRSSGPTKLAEWRERLERFSSCGLAVARFCAQEHVSVASFYHWRKKLGHKGRRRRMTDGHPRHRTGPAGGRGVFQPVAVVPGGARVRSGSVRLGSGGASGLHSVALRHAH